MSMTVDSDFIDPHGEQFIIGEIKKLTHRKLKLPGEGRSHIIRYGWDYLGDGWMGDIPWWLEFGGISYDSVTINEYPVGHTIAPHIDSMKFADTVRILSLGTEATIVFTSPAGEEKYYDLPPRSLASFSGELRQKWKHHTLPADGVRYSIVFRKKL